MVSAGVPPHVHQDGNLLSRFGLRRFRVQGSGYRGQGSWFKVQG